MTLHQLKVFVVVAKLRSFTQAGDSLRIAQPSVSLLIKGLERELKVQLFEKLGNRILLTGAGERLLQRAEEIVAKMEGIKEEMDEIKGLKKGKVSIGSSALAAASFLPRAIRGFKKKYPGIEVILKVQKSDILEKKLLEGELDIAILSWVPRFPYLVVEPYRADEIIVIAPPKHPLARKRSVSLELLAKQPLITQGRGGPIRNMIEQSFEKQGLKFVPTLELGGRDATRSAVANRLGIGFATKHYARWDIKAGRLKALNVPQLRLKRTMYIAVHRPRENSFPVRAFIDFLDAMKVHGKIEKS